MNRFKSFFNRIKWETLITALFAVATGIVFLVAPTDSGRVLCYVTGVIFLILGSVMLVRFFSFGPMLGSYFLVLSVLLLGVGILCLARPDLMLGILTVIFGIFLVVDGIVKVQNGIECIRAHARGAWSLFVLAALSVLLGCLVMFGSFDSVMIFVGVSLVIDGISDIVVTVAFSSHIRRAEKRLRDYFDRNRGQ